MSYYMTTTFAGTFDEALAAATGALQEQGFGVLSDIDVSATLKRKLNVEFPRYRILGACNPAFAHQALQEEDKIGTLLPCNVVVREATDHTVEIAAVDPAESMQVVGNEALLPIANEVRGRLQAVISSLGEVAT
ncbi:MAG: DUF302 domain-containing protein [Alkalispirochaeta sp.]